jgi:hypothetical protein
VVRQFSRARRSERGWLTYEFTEEMAQRVVAYIGRNDSIDCKCLADDLTGLHAVHGGAARLELRASARAQRKRAYQIAASAAKLRGLLQDDVAPLSVSVTGPSASASKADAQAYVSDLVRRLTVLSKRASDSAERLEVLQLATKDAESEATRYVNAAGLRTVFHAHFGRCRRRARVASPSEFERFAAAFAKEIGVTALTAEGFKSAKRRGKRRGRQTPKVE